MEAPANPDGTPNQASHMILRAMEAPGPGGTPGRWITVETDAPWAEENKRWTLPGPDYEPLLRGGFERCLLRASGPDLPPGTRILELRSAKEPVRGEFHLSISSSFPTYLVSLRPIWSNHHFTVGRERDDWVVLSYSDPFTPGLLVRGSGVLPR